MSKQTEQESSRLAIEQDIIKMEKRCEQIQHEGWLRWVEMKQDIHSLREELTEIKQKLFDNKAENYIAKLKLIQKLGKEV